MLKLAQAGVFLMGCGTVPAAHQQAGVEHRPLVPAQVSSVAPAQAQPLPLAEPPLPLAEPPAPVSLVDQLPPMDFAVPLDTESVVSAANKKLSMQLNVVGLGLHRKKKFVEAEGKYKGALVANPGNLLARYNLSCVYNLMGQSNRGLALLSEMQRADCPGCVGAVLTAEKDFDWQSHWMDPTLWEILAIESPSANTDLSAWWEPKVFVCPKGTRKRGTEPEGEADPGELKCVKPNGQLHGPYHSASLVDSAHDAITTSAGPYRNGKKHGHWMEGEAMGHYVSGLKQGRWVDERFHDTEYAAYVGGKVHGRRVILERGEDDGLFLRFEANYESGQRHGISREFSAANRPLSTRSYARGKAEGTWTEFDEQANKRRVHSYSNGVPHGLFEFWDAQGKSLARFTMDKGTGDWLVIDESGAITDKGRLDNSKKSGAWIESNDESKEVGRYENNARKGNWTGTWKNGAKKYTGAYKGGLEEGPWTFFDTDNDLFAEGNYKSGKPHGTWKVYGAVVEQELEFRRGSLFRWDGAKLEADDRRGWEYVEHDFPVFVEPLSEEDVEALEYGEY